MSNRAISFLVMTLASCALSGSAGCLPFSSVDRYHTNPIHDSPRGVYLETSFEEHDWYKKWGLDKSPQNCDVLDSDPAHGFKPLHGKALRITIEKGTHGGVDQLRFHFAKDRDQQPEEMYFRYYLRLGSDFTPISGGKLPGFAGTYGKAGWGMRKPEGDDGWSARGSFSKADDDGRIEFGSYIYYMGQPKEHGDVLRWQIDDRGTLERNRWYCVEQYIKLNTPGKADGILRGWIDGKLAFEKNDIRFRGDRDLRVEEVWMNVYHGGPEVAIHDHHLYIDDVVISEKRIGPENSKSAAAAARR